MPARRVYFVDFSRGNVTPSTDLLRWGLMTEGGSGIHGEHGDADGLVLTASRPDTSTSPGVEDIFVVPHGLPVESRLLMSLVFDQPWAEPTPGGARPPDQWAVGLKVSKSLATADTPPTDNTLGGFIPVTCQFNARGTTEIGVRLNTPFALQTDGSVTATDLDLAPGYDKYAGSNLYPGTPFELKVLFCGVQAIPQPGLHRAALGYAVGCGFLSIGFPSIGTQHDQRVFSQRGIWTETDIKPASFEPSIGAIGPSLSMSRGTGTVFAHLRTFSVDVWPPAVGAVPHPE